MNATDRQLSAAERFFYREAGYALRPHETEGEARASGARQLARAEEWARDQGYWFEWMPDCDGCTGCECGSGDCPCCDGAPHETLGCVMLDADGGVMPYSLWGVCGATSAYRRVVEAELALEAMMAEASA
jgi:hypothetical protein